MKAVCASVIFFYTSHFISLSLSLVFCVRERGAWRPTDRRLLTAGIPLLIKRCRKYSTPTLQLGFAHHERVDE